MYIQPTCSRNVCPDKLIFKNNGIKYRTTEQMTQDEIEFYLNKRYSIFNINGTKIIAISPKRAMQTFVRIQNL